MELHQASLSNKGYRHGCSLNSITNRSITSYLITNYERPQSDTKNYGLQTPDSGLNDEWARNEAKKLWSTDSRLWTKLRMGA
uniref:hypothetical protein n=1 Tax=uncultured Microscilla sp. TaxID=432653 RepID=UPI002603FD19